MQLNPNLKIHVGDLPVDIRRDKFNQLTKDASLLPLEGNDPKDWAAMSKRVGDSGQVTEQDMAQLKKFATAAATGKNSLWDTIKDPKSTQEQRDAALASLARVTPFMEGYRSLAEAQKSSAARAAVASLASASFGPTCVLQAYQTFANLSAEDLRPLVDSLPASPGVFLPVKTHNPAYLQMDQHLATSNLLGDPADLMHRKFLT